MIYTSCSGCRQSNSDKSPCLNLVGHSLWFAKYPSKLAVTCTRGQVQDHLMEIFSDGVDTTLSKPVQFSKGALKLIVVVSRVWLFETPQTAACQASLSFTISQNLFKLVSIESVMPSNHLILCFPLLLLLLIFPSFRDFSSESALHIRWPKYWNFSFSTFSPSIKYSTLISFMIVWLISLLSKGLSRVFSFSHVWLCDPMDCSLLGFSVHRILQARILQWVAISFSRGFSQPSDQNLISYVIGRFFNIWAARETQCFLMNIY